MDHAYEMAFDALGLVLTHMEEQKEKDPTPSKPQDITLLPEQFLIIIEFDMAAYKKKTNGKSIKKTLSIPEYLNEAVLDPNINFYQLLQETLIPKLKNN